MFLAILYEICLWILALIMLPKLLYQRIFLGKYKQSLLYRFGFHFPNIQKQKRELIWIHAVSVGETKAVAALAKMFKENGQNPILLISSVSETGHAEAKRSMPFADYHVYLPLDFFAIINAIVKRVRPDRVIITEGDFWFHFLRCCKKSGATISVANGKLSDTSLKRYRYVPFFAKALFKNLSLFCVQNEEYKSNFLSVGIPQNKIVVTGNMKFDEKTSTLDQSDITAWKKELHIAESDPVLVVGSTHEPEEHLVIEAAKNVWKQFPKMKILLVPRRPERFDEVANLLVKSEINFSRYSEKNVKKEASLILIDAMGVLRKCYQLATVAIVAGSFTEKVGGHNIIEPSAYGVPVLFGPYTHTQKEMVALVKKYSAGLQLESTLVAETILDLLQNDKRRKSLGQNGLQMISEMQGATKRTFDAHFTLYENVRV